jgi:hypothetical protein
MRLFSWFGGSSLLVGLSLLVSCSATRAVKSTDTAREGQRLIKEAAAITSKASSHQIAQVGEAGQTIFKTPQATLASAFIRQFGDGTVIDKVMVRQVRGDAKEAATYYLIGVGLRDGNYRAMALPLSTIGTSLNLNPNAERYLLVGMGCSSCFFEFEGSRIVGSSCGGNGECNFRVLNDNTLFVSR